MIDDIDCRGVLRLSFYNRDTHMDPQAAVVRLLVDGYVALPDILTGTELAALDAAFERRARETGTRWFDWETLDGIPEFVGYLAHPNLMKYVTAFAEYMGEEAVFANSSGARDSYNPANPGPSYEPANLRHGPLGWHDDVVGMKNPQSEAIQMLLASLLYLDETFADNGAYCSAVGSHYLARATPDKKPILAKPDFVLDNCELKPVPLKPGGVVLYRGHHWHGVVPMKQRRRLVLQSFTTRRHYNMQIGHTQLSEKSRALLTPAQKKYVTSYSQA
ncbi:MAG: phytanoyl-CoA dioxygenase family protein [Phycisphaeraceae bacterium]|nr:phytanoyl-CoA dioxygenase family protein [Phycisphaeraceae bacterium]